MSKAKTPVMVVNPPPRAEEKLAPGQVRYLLHVDPELVPQPVATVPSPGLGRLPIGECIGKTILCPECGKPASVDNARGGRTPTQVISSKWWVLVKCKGVCGSKLRKVAELVELHPDSVPRPVFKTLGQAVGKFIKCPKPDCQAKSRAAWTADDGHVIECPTHLSEPYPSETVVEVIG